MLASCAVHSTTAEQRRPAKAHGNPQRRQQILCLDGSKSNGRSPDTFATANAFRESLLPIRLDNGNSGSLLAGLATLDQSSRRSQTERVPWRRIPESWFRHNRASARRPRIEEIQPVSIASVFAWLGYECRSLHD